MAIISAGYDGTVDEVQFAKMLPRAGASEYGVDLPGDFRVSAVAGQDRTVSIAPGTAWGHSVIDVSDANGTRQLASEPSGSRWDMIVLRRNWQPPGGSTTIDVIKGAGAPIVVSRNTNPGVIDDQPLALVQVKAGSTAIGEIVDLRVWARNGGVTANSDYVRHYLDTMGTVVEINKVRWRRKPGDNNVPKWVDETKEDDTGILTGGISLPNTSTWRIEARWVQRRNGTVTAHVVARYLSATPLKVNSSGNITDTRVTTMPPGFRPSLDDWPVTASREKVTQWFARVETGGHLRLVGGIPGMEIKDRDLVYFHMHYPTAS